MEQSPSSEVNNFSASWEFLCMLWNPPEFPYSVHKSMPFIPTQRHMNPVHFRPSYFCRIHFYILSSILCLVLTSGSCPSGSTAKILHLFFAPMPQQSHTRSLAHSHTHKTVIIFGNEIKRDCEFPSYTFNYLGCIDGYLNYS